jgi:hypothetical protein
MSVQTAILEGTIRTTGPGAGNYVGWLEVTNVGQQQCTIDGYLGLQLVANGAPLPTTVEDTPPPPTPVVLRPGETAEARLSWSDMTGCTQPSSGTPTDLVVTPPNGAAPSFDVAWTYGPVCQGVLHIGALSIPPN